MLAEVSNTPWNQRHYYLVTMGSDEMTDKAFHVSPFMKMNMQYKWRVNPPDDKAFVHIENHDKEQHNKKVFDATVALSKLDMTTSNNGNATTAARSDWLTLPFMNFKVLQGIYWQALKLWRKKAPFYDHPLSSTKRDSAG